MLSCECDYEPEPGDIWWYQPNDYTSYSSKRRTKCCSCGEKISKDDLVTAFERYKVPDTDIEVKIYGEDGEVPRAYWYMCEKCSDIMFSLSELGFCIDIRQKMQNLLKEYHDVYGVK